MRHAWFILRIALAISSCALCLLAALAWGRGYWRRDVLTLKLDDSRAVWIESVRGGVQFVRAGNTPPNKFKTGWQVAPPASPAPRASFWGFRGWTGVVPPIWGGAAARPLRLEVLVVPSWAIILTTAVYPSLFLISRWRNRRRRHSRGFPLDT